MKLSNEVRELENKNEKGMFPFNLQFFAEPAGDDEEQDDVDDESGDDSNKDDKDDEKKFTQSQVSKMMAKEKKQGRSSILKEFGFKDEKHAKSEMAKFNEWKKSQLTDEEKANQEKSELEIRAAQALREAEIAKAQVEALKLGAKPDCVEDIIALAMAKMTDDGDIKTLIAEIKTKHASMFSDGSEEENKGKGKKGTGTSLSDLSNQSKSKDETKEEPKNLGAKLAAKRSASASKKSYWK